MPTKSRILLLVLLTVSLATGLLHGQNKATPGFHPALRDSTYILGPLDRVNAAVAGQDGTFYLAGVSLTSRSAIDPAKAFAGEGDAFVAHLSADGSTLLYRKYLGKTGLSEARALTVDGAGNVYVTGVTSAADFPVLHALKPECSRNDSGECRRDAFVVELDRDGSIVFATRLGATGDTAGNAIALDAKRNIVVGGSTTAYDLATPAAAQTAPGGSGDGFVASLKTDGSALRFVTFLGGTGADEVRAIAVGRDGSIAATGVTESADFPTRSALQSSCRTKGSDPCNQAFVVRLSPDGSTFLYSTYLGGSGRNAANAIAIDADGNTYVAGTTNAADFPTSRGLPGAAGSNDAFVAKLTSDGSALTFSTLLGGSGSDRANAIARDSEGNIHVAGSTQSEDFPTRNPLQASCSKKGDGSCSVDAFIATLDPAGSLQFSTYLGGHASDGIRAIASDAQGSLHVAGWTASSDFPVLGSQTPPVAGSFVATIAGFLKNLPPVSCGAGTNNWTGTAGDNQWTTATNWSTGAVPISTDNVCVASSFTHSISVGSLAAANQTIASLNAGAPLAFTGGPLTISGTSTFAGDLAISGGVLTLTGASSITTLELSGGIVSGAGAITISGLLTWSAGSMCTTQASGACTVPGSNATTNASGGITILSVPTLNGRTLNTAGTSSSTGFFELLMTNGAVVNNQAGATWTLGSDFDILNEGGTGTNTFNNAGTFTKTGGTSTSQVSAVFNNNTGGSVGNGSGTIIFSGGGTGAGSWAASSGATITFSGGSFTLTGGISGAGTFNFQGGTVALNGAAHTYNVTGTTMVSGGTVTFKNGIVLSIGNQLTFSGGVGSFGSNSPKPKTMSMSSGTYAGTGALTISGVFTWSGGTMCTTQSAGSCTVPTKNATTNANGGMVLSSVMGLNGRTLKTKKTTSNTSFVELLMSNGAMVSNLAKAIWNLGSDFDILNEGGTGTNTFTNAGTFEKTGGTSTSQMSTVFNNNTGGSVSVGTGTVLFSGGGTGPGKWAASSGGTLTMSGGSFTLTGGFSGAGTINFQGGTVTLSGAAGSYNVTGATTISGATTTFSAGVITSVGNPLTVSGGLADFQSNAVSVATMNLSSGTYAGTGALTVSGALTWSGGVMCTTQSAGTCTVPGSNATTNANGGITISSVPTLNGRTLNIAGTSNATAFFELLMSNGAIVNVPTGATWTLGSDFDILNEGGTGANTFTNAGTFTKTGGTSTSQVSTAFNNSGSVSAGSGTLDFTGAYTQTAGSTSLSGGTLSFTSGAIIQGGSFAGAGNVSGGISNSAGVLAPGTGTTAGTITLTGTNTYSQGSSASYNVKVGGTAAGQFDTVVVGGAATLGGPLNLTLINGFAPAHGTKFTVMTFASKTGTFASVTSGWSVSYTATSAVATFN